jgi:hypothetical protein
LKYCVKTLPKNTWRKTGLLYCLQTNLSFCTIHMCRPWSTNCVVAIVNSVCFSTWRTGTHQRSKRGPLPWNDKMLRIRVLNVIPVCCEPLRRRNREDIPRCEPLHITVGPKPYVYTRTSSLPIYPCWEPWCKRLPRNKAQNKTKQNKLKLSK